MKKMLRTPKCPKTKSITDANKNAQSGKSSPRSPKIAKHKPLPREATGSKRNRMIDHPLSMA